MLATIHAPALTGTTAELVEIECDLANGLPGIIVVGLGDKAVDEARERVRSALKNTGLIVPPKRITLNLAPADLPKDGTGYDLGLAIAILAASEQLPPEAMVGKLFYGELSLEGKVRPVRGALAAAELAADNQIDELFLSVEDAGLAANVNVKRVYAVASLSDLYRHLTGEKLLKVVKKSTITTTDVPEPEVDLAMVYGQDQAKRALEIAAAGDHHLLLTGPPGSGKTLLAHALVGLLPAPTRVEQLEIYKLYNLAGLPPPPYRPFRTPHHTASSIALIGGGANPRPGEISLSHNGILLLDEVAEFPRSVLEVLRGPLEDQQVTVARATRTVTYPAKFLMVATRNPCPCGYANDSRRRCTCDGGAINRYSQKLSGPLLDRIDLCVDVARIETDRLVGSDPSESSAAVRKRIIGARRIQHQRFGDHTLNGQMTSSQVKARCELDDTTRALARHAIDHLALSGRSYHRVLKVARTIADLASSPNIKQEHFTEALQYRSRTNN